MHRLSTSLNTLTFVPARSRRLGRCSGLPMLAVFRGKHPLNLVCWRSCFSPDRVLSTLPTAHRPVVLNYILHISPYQESLLLDLRSDSFLRRSVLGKADGSRSRMAYGRSGIEIQPLQSVDYQKVNSKVGLELSFFSSSSHLDAPNQPRAEGESSSR